MQSPLLQSRQHYSEATLHSEAHHTLRGRTCFQRSWHRRAQLAAVSQASWTCQDHKGVAYVAELVACATA